MASMIRIKICQVIEMSQPPDYMAEKNYFCRTCRAKVMNAGGPPEPWLGVRVFCNRVNAEDTNTRAFGLFCSKDCLISYVQSFKGVRVHPIEPADRADRPVQSILAASTGQP